MTDDQLRNAISDLAAIDNEGLLRAVRLEFSQACQEAGGLPDADERQRQLTASQIGAATKARDIARVAAHLFGLPLVQCEQAAREVLVSDPWADIALDIIAAHLPAPTPQAVEPTGSKPARRKW